MRAAPVVTWLVRQCQRQGWKQGWPPGKCPNAAHSLVGLPFWGSCSFPQLSSTCCVQSERRAGSGAPESALFAPDEAAGGLCGYGLFRGCLVSTCGFLACERLELQR